MLTVRDYVYESVNFGMNENCNNWEDGMDELLDHSLRKHFKRLVKHTKFIFTVNMLFPPFVLKMYVANFLTDFLKSA